MPLRNPGRAGDAMTLAERSTGASTGANTDTRSIEDITLTIPNCSRTTSPTNCSGACAANRRPLEPGGDTWSGFWSITKYEDTRYVAHHTEMFISSKGIVGPGLRPDAMTKLMAEDPATASQASGGNASIITMDPPRHVKMRRLVNKRFTPRAVNAMEDEIRRITNQILDKIAGRGSCDFVLDVASQLPLAVICHMMGPKKKPGR